MRINLISPMRGHEKETTEFRRTMLKESPVINGGCDLESYENYEKWLRHVKRCKKSNTVPKGLVVSTTFLGVNESNEVVGIVNIRHHLNDNLMVYGGHIGYSVAPQFRRQGVATQLLEGGLDFLRQRDVIRGLITCNVENIPSQKTILKAGGILENEVVVNGDVQQRYWISL